MKPKRILILSLAYYPELVGGAEVAIKEITDRFAEKAEVFSAQSTQGKGPQPKADEPMAQASGWDMITLRLNSRLPKFEKIGNVNVYRIGWAKNNPSAKDLVKFPLYLNKVFYPLFATWKFWQLDRKNHYDGIWAMMSYMGMTAVLIRMFVRKIAFVLTLQEGDSFEHVLGRKRVRLFLPLIRKAFREAVIVQVISNYLAKWAKEMGAKKIDVIPNGVNFSRFTIHDSRFTIRGKYGIGKNEKVVITTSRLVPKNGVDILIKAFKFLPEDVKLLIVGDGPLENELKLLTTNYSLLTRIVFAGFVTQEQIPDYLASADVFARLSRSEGQGISFIEAMAVGLPVVATSVGGITDFLRDKETGLFAEVDNPEDAARKILILLRDEAIRQSIVESAKKMVAERYDWNKLVTRMKSEVFVEFNAD